MLPLILFSTLLLALIVGLVVAGSLFVVIWTRAVPLALAVLGGLGISALLAGGTGPAVGSTIVASLALFIVFEPVRARLARRRDRRARYDVDVVATRAPVRPARKPAVSRTASSPTALDIAFDMLVANADWAASRVAGARESCRLFLATAGAAGWDSDAADFAIRVRAGIPDHIGKCLACCNLATPAERRAILDTCIFDIEHVAAEADRVRARLRPAAQKDMHLQSQYLKHKAPSDPFAID